MALKSGKEGVPETVSDKSEASQDAPQDEHAEASTSEATDLSDDAEARIRSKVQKLERQLRGQYGYDRERHGGFDRYQE